MAKEAAACPHCGKSPDAPVARAAPPPLQVPAKPAAVITTTWRVARGGTFSMGGGMCRAVEGTVVTLAAYGRDGIDRMLARGIVLEPIKK